MQVQQLRFPAHQWTYPITGQLGFAESDPNHQSGTNRTVSAFKHSHSNVTILRVSGPMGGILGWLHCPSCAISYATDSTSSIVSWSGLWWIMPKVSCSCRWAIGQLAHGLVGKKLADSKYTKPEQAAYWSVLVRVPASAQITIQGLSGAQGFYVEPRTDSGKEVDDSFGMVWLGELSLPDLSHRLKTTPNAIAIGRLRSK